MKKYLLLIISLSLLLYSCKYDYPELPPETQVGLNTFGCLVNGELVIPHGTTWLENCCYQPIATYSKGSKKLKIWGYGQHSQAFVFTINEVQGLASTAMDTVMYFSPNIETGSYYGGNKIGELKLSKLDVDNMVVSGTFQFTGLLSSLANMQVIDPNKAVIVTLGRFDIKMTVTD